MFEAERCHLRTRELRILTRDEVSYSCEIESEEQRRQFLWGRIVARRVISLYTGLRPEDLQFRRNRNGRPELKGRTHPLRFNVTHTGMLVLIAVRRDGLLGIDAEVLRDSSDLSEVAVEFFSAKELCILRNSDVGSRAAVFFRLWTGKEACVKAAGRGISNMGLKRLDLSRSILKRSHFQPKPSLYVRWFTPLPGSVAAVACDARPKAIRFFRWGTRRP